MNLENILQEFENIVEKDMQDYSQFIIDFIDDAIIDLPEEEDDIKEFERALCYRIENILGIVKKGIDRDLFIKLLKSIDNI